MGDRPSGVVTFLFTDIEGSTRRWEQDSEAMRAALTAHDEALRTSIEAYGGWLFKHTGDGVCAAFASPRSAVDAAIDAQRSLQLPVRMGIATGEAESRGDDYFGPALNRAARVMGAGHGGQILVASIAAALSKGLDLIDLGPKRLRDLSEPVVIHQVRAEGLRSDFPPLNTLDANPGNLRPICTSFVGRDRELAGLQEAVAANRLVTLTGAGGVGKTRLALQAAAGLTPEFADGVWAIELAAVNDPDEVPDAVATALGITHHPGLSIAESVAAALERRDTLLVIDNCEHVLDAAGELVSIILRRSETARVLATSREGLQIGDERLWPVPSLGTDDGIDSASVVLFVDRARAVVPDFSVTAPQDADAVVEICRRLDGIPLAIELAASRMVSMSPIDVRDRLDDRFRLLGGPQRGLERQQTLRQTVQWSYDLLTDDESQVLNRCSVFAGGFDLAAATAVAGFGALDEFAVLDLLDALVRKSLLVVDRSARRARYLMLETIRQFAESELSTDTIDEIGDRHASYFADEAVDHFDLWLGLEQRHALDWVDSEFANLRAGFGWATDRSDLTTAAAIAAHTTLLASSLQRYEPVGWAEEILDRATDANLPWLPRLHTAAGFCVFAGRADDSVAHAQRAVDLGGDPRYDPFEDRWDLNIQSIAHLYHGEIDRGLEIYADLATQPGLARVFGLTGQVFALPMTGRTEEAKALAESALAAARDQENPEYIAWALAVSGRVAADTDPVRALAILRDGLSYARDNRLPFIEAIIARDAAELEAAHGNLDDGLALFDATLDSFQRAGDDGSVGSALASLAVFYSHIDEPELAATLYGASTHHGTISWVTDLPDTIDQLRAVLGHEVFDELTTAGAGMDSNDAVHYARTHIRLSRRQARAAS